MLLSMLLLPPKNYQAPLITITLAVKDDRKELVNFIDQKAFDVILKTSAEKFNGQDREDFELIQKNKSRAT